MQHLPTANGGSGDSWPDSERKRKFKSNFDNHEILASIASDIWFAIKAKLTCWNSSYSVNSRLNFTLIISYLSLETNNLPCGIPTDPTTLESSDIPSSDMYGAINEVSKKKGNFNTKRNSLLCKPKNNLAQTFLQFCQRSFFCRPYSRYVFLVFSCSYLKHNESPRACLFSTATFGRAFIAFSRNMISQNAARYDSESRL